MPAVGSCSSARLLVPEMVRRTRICKRASFSFLSLRRNKWAEGDGMVECGWVIEARI